MCNTRGWQHRGTKFCCPDFPLSVLYGPWAWQTALRIARSGLRFCAVDLVPTAVHAHCCETFKQTPVLLAAVGKAWHRRLRPAIVALPPGLAVPPRLGRAKEAQWIWSPAYEKELAPQGTCYFRKTFNLGRPSKAKSKSPADDNYELYVNGRQVGSGKNWKVLDVYDITKYLVQGANTIAVKADEHRQGSAGLVARVVVKQQGNTHVDYSTDATWKTALKEFPQWQKTALQRRAVAGRPQLRRAGRHAALGQRSHLAGAGDRFKVTPEFHVEWVIEPKETGSLICMTFDEFGQIIAARENGPLIVIRDDDKDGLVDTVSHATATK